MGIVISYFGLKEYFENYNYQEIMDFMVILVMIGF